LCRGLWRAQGKHLLHKADRFYCVHSTQYSHLVSVCKLTAVGISACYSVSAEIAQFTNGLGELWTLMKGNQCLTMDLLAASSSHQLTLLTLKKLYCIAYSPVGSRKRRDEEDAMYFFEMYLQDCEGKHSKQLFLASSNCLINYHSAYCLGPLVNHLFLQNIIMCSLLASLAAEFYCYSCPEITFTQTYVVIQRAQLHADILHMQTHSTAKLVCRQTMTS